jgi:hypothetical protein
MGFIDEIFIFTGNGSVMEDQKNWIDEANIQIYVPINNGIELPSHLTPY